MSEHPAILVVDGNPTWVRSLFEAVGEHTRVDMLRVEPLRRWRGPERPPAPLRWRGENGVRVQTVPNPGWTRLRILTERLIAQRVGAWLRGQRGERVVVYNLPFYAPVAERFAGRPGLRQVYYAFDPYRFYGWPVERVNRQEAALLRRCEEVFAVSRALQEDFAAQRPGRVHYLPNAVAPAFLDQLRAPNQPRPADLEAIAGRIVGCTGQINRSYDWELIEAVAGLVPQATLVFVGPIFDEPPEIRARIERVLALPNVRWLGRKPHGELPAYLRGFDVCFNPLAVNEHNDRRSPLRLYDYLATDKPVVSTAVREAQEHAGHIRIGRTPQEVAIELRAALEAAVPVDLAARRAYIARHTWRERALEFLGCLRRAS